MSNEFKGNPDFPKVGAMIQKKDLGKDGKVQYYLKVDKDVDLRVNGKKVSAINIERPTSKYDRMLDSGRITPEEYNEKIAMFSDGGELSFIKFEFSADLRPPKK